MPLAQLLSVMSFMFQCCSLMCPHDAVQFLYVCLSLLSLRPALGVVGSAVGG